MFKLGLCSVTFRDSSVEEVIDISKKAGISGIEWGGDVHVPPLSDRAKEVARLTEQAGLEVVSYGSYYRLGHGENNQFEEILQTAIQLKAPGIRVWAGKKGSEQADEKYRKKVAEDARRIAELAKEADIRIHLEYHGKTLTDTAESAADLLKMINHESVFLYWQPAVSLPVENRLKNIEKIRQWLSNIHVFHWHGTEKLPFENGMEEWKKYLNKLEPEADETRYLLMEFVKDGKPTQFFDDVQALKSLVND
ncbi:sugar phosphate isomerase/epimerase family protein [Virgibacillus halodenitrificans]|uniref:sugar phosphate isomerase/epimerase family protein n=1 Tax=Virgibacillus halodenitrificans TaxID=1482 RepID=UPI002DB8A25C|nr:TIM barrel protein [Virgibacillus halodenitrificans]MEC2158339.1 TIM barrel protein [Virgibacillus halodenitrificans]